MRRLDDARLCDLDLREDAPRLEQQRRARIGETHLTIGALEKTNAEIPLERLHLVGERGLRRREHLRGFTKVQALGHRDEVPQLSKVQGVAPRVEAGEVR